MYTTEQEMNNFLDEYKRSRVIIESTVRATLNRALEFEHKFNQPFYEFNVESRVLIGTRKTVNEWRISNLTSNIYG